MKWIAEMTGRVGPARSGPWHTAGHPAWPGAFLSILFVLWLSGVPLTAQPKLTASLDRDTITLGESATLSLAFEGIKPTQLPVIPAPQNLGIQYVGQSTELQMINGQTSLSVKLNYRVVPARPGEFVIPAIQVVMDQQRLSAQPIKFRVLPADTTAPETTGTARFAFLKLIVPKTSVFLGEVLPIELQLYFAARGDQLQLPQLQSEGFSFGPIVQSPQNQNPPATQVGNSTYRILSFKTTATAAKTGTLTLGPAQCSLVLYIPTARRARDPLEEFFDFGPRTQRQAVTLTSEALKIEVLPLPTMNQPPGFAGAVGTFEWAVTAGPTNVTTGDPITLQIQLAGEGALDALALPEADWREFKTYPPNSKTETTDPLGIKGVKTFEQVIIPQNAHVKEIPGLAFSFFDPQRKEYRTLTHPPIPLSVKASSGGPPQPSLASGRVEDESAGSSSDVAHIKAYLGEVGPPQPVWLQQPWFLAWQGLPVLGWLLAFGWRQRQDNLAKNPRRRRRLEVASTVRQGLEDLRRLASEDKPQEFFAMVFRLLQEQLGERLDLPASAITESVLEERLRPLGASEDLLGRLHELFQACNQARYAGHLTRQQLNLRWPEIDQALRDLQALKDSYGKQA